VTLPPLVLFLKICSTVRSKSGTTVERIGADPCNEVSSYWLSIPLAQRDLTAFGVYNPIFGNASSGIFCMFVAIVAAAVGLTRANNFDN
jgi:hypothetical protein